MASEVYTSTVNLPGGWSAHTDQEIDVDSYTPEQRDLLQAWIDNGLVAKATKKHAKQVHAELAVEARVGEPGGQHAEGTTAGQGLTEDAPEPVDEPARKGRRS